MSERFALQRRAVVAEILAARGDALVIAGLGSPAWDTAAAGDDERNFYLWGAMGGAALCALGLALAQPDRPVLAITGDGEQLMGLGGLATVAVQAPANLALVVLDNERYGETGMQDTHTRFGVDLAGVAAACGFALSRTVREARELTELVPLLYAGAGPVFAAVKVRPDSAAASLPPRDGTYLKHRFRAAVLGGEAD